MNTSQIFLSLKKGKEKGKRSFNDATISHLKGPTASEHEEVMSNFEAAEYYSMLASAISGGVESPIQFVTQVIEKFFNSFISAKYKCLL